jgi:hypothetical protein
LKHFSGQSTNPAALAFSGRSLNGSSENLPNSVANSQANILQVFFITNNYFSFRTKIGNIANIVFARVRSFEERLLNTLAAYVPTCSGR